MQPFLILDQVNKSFFQLPQSVIAVERATFSIGAGEFFTLLGPSGCGKTTLLRLIAGLEEPESGKIILEDVDMTLLPPQQRPVNTVFQSYALFPHMTVFENISFGPRMKNRPAAEIETDVKTALRMVRMEDLARRKPQELSGGQQQRVALARALINKPRVLLLDEPLSALDYKLRKDMRGELKRLQAETGITFIFVTHDQDEALSMSDRIAVMDKGRVLQIGTPQEIYARPSCRFVADFIGECNFVSAKSLGLPDAGDVGFRPENAFLDAGTGIEGRVLAVHYAGALTYYTLSLVSGETVKIRTEAHLEKGTAVRFSVAPENLIRCAD